MKATWNSHADQPVEDSKRISDLILPPLEEALMALKKKVALPLTLALGLTAVLTMVSVAVAAHPRPANLGAKKLTFTMVPAFKACGAPNSTHGAPLGAPSCTPANAARQTSRNLTVGNIFRGISNGRSSFTIEVICTNGQTPPCPAPGDQEDVKLTAFASDIRCKAGVRASACPNENGPPAGVPGNDYRGEVQGDATIRITDAFNGPPGFTTHGTVVDLPFPVKARCIGTPGNTNIGGRCSVNTSADTVVPNVVKERRKAVVQIGQIHVNDGGSDGVVDTAPNDLFAVQGIYIP
jgi:hypothetical protein